MPKIKTCKGIAKRFKTTGSGKVVHYSGGKGHMNRRKTKRRLRNLKLKSVVQGRIGRNIKRLLGA